MILPVIVLVTTAVEAIWALHVVPVALNTPPWVLGHFMAPVALLALALLRLQRTAARAAVALLIGLAYLAGLSYRVGGPDLGQISSIAGPYIILALALEIVAVTASRGPRRGLQLLTWKHVALTVIAAVAVAITSYPWTLVVIPLICAAMALTSSLGRWLLVLLAIPLGPYVAVPYLYGGPWGSHMNIYLAPLMSPGAVGPVGQAYVLAGVFLGVFLIAACRESFRSRKLVPPSR